MYYSQHMFLEAVNTARTDQKASKAMFRYYYNKLKELETRDVVAFGRHQLTEQIKPIGEEAIKRPITWEIIDKQEDRILLLSEYILDWEMFDEGGDEWENSEIREMLNGEYCRAWFTKEEQSLLYPEPDPVFLLSIDEAKKYFGESDRGRAVMLVSDIERYGKGEDDWRPCIEEWENEWWLRSPGTEGGTAFVGSNGCIEEEGYDSDADEFGVRPAIWLDLNKLKALFEN